MKEARKKRASKARPKEKTKSHKEPTPWQGLPDDLSTYAGFVYKVVNKTNGMQYIGRKYFKAQSKVKIPGKTRRKRVEKESDWRYYRTSSKKVQEDILLLGLDRFEFLVLSLHETRAATNYEETRVQFTHDVINRNDYYNDNILHRYYRKK